MSTNVWMQVSSSARGDDERVEAKYFFGVGMVVVSTGSGDLYMTPDIAADLHDRLAKALNDYTATSGTGSKAVA
ncbi:MULTISPECIES: hypothetical protein [Nocardia]|uniref:hypothetical protein n=1 Tax=Nocardia TaxID=1817 RepID=UPI0013583902|nr:MULTISPECIES: hypothetical protein [Nocardia]